MSWLTGWTRRKLKIVENLTVSDYQMKLIIHKSGSGPDTSTDIYLGGNCRDDFADLRFTGPDQTTLLSYWIESITGTTPNLVATVWIKVPTLIPTNNIYIYYDNPSATTASNGSNTFIAWHGSATSTFLDSLLIDITSFIYEGKVRATSDTHLLYWGVANVTNNTGDMLALTTYTAGNYMEANSYNNGVNSYSQQSPRFPTNTWYKLKIVKTTRADFYRDSIVVTSGLTTNLPDQPTGLLFRTDIGTGEQEYSFVRKYASPEPTFSALGTEELSITATNMTLNTNTCAGPCQIIAGVTWQNLGNSNVIFTPAILIDGTTIAYAISNITIGPYPTTGSSTITTPTLLAGTHQICPYPN